MPFISDFKQFLIKINVFIHNQNYWNIKNLKLAWVDITNLNARAPVVSNQIFVKVLRLPHSGCSKVFKNIFENLNGQSRNISPSQAPSQPQAQPQSQLQSQYNFQQLKSNANINKPTITLSVTSIIKSIILKLIEKCWISNT